MAGVNGAGVDMNTDQTSTLMNQLGRVAADLASAWNGLKPAIDAKAGQLGKGPMGRALADGYIPASESVSTGTDLAADRTARRATIGGHLVEVYRAADAQSAQTIEGVN